MRVALPSPLIEYTQGQRDVEADGETLDALLTNLDRRYPGIRFRMIDEQGRIRAHIKLFVDKAIQRDLSYSLANKQVVDIVAALSGG